MFDYVYVCVSLRFLFVHGCVRVCLFALRCVIFRFVVYVCDC